jgi:hypothetical protein
MPDPFITVADLGDYIGRDVSADDGAVIAIDAACDICRDVAGVDFNAGTATFAADGTGTDALVLPTQPVSSVSSVMVAGAAITDYTLAGNGVLLRGTAGAYPRPVWPAGRQNVTGTAVTGYSSADLPRSVRMVALSIASRLVIQGPAQEESLGSSRVKYSVASTDLTNGELRILRKYGAK